MSEQLRARYLSALGLVQYRPRVGRAVERGRTDIKGTQKRFPQQDPGRGVIDSDSAGPPGRHFEARGADNANLGREHLDLLASALVAPSVAAATVEAKNAEAQTDTGQDPISVGSTGPAFRLACWRVSEQLLVIDSLQPGERPDSRCVTLLGNILKAIGQQPDLLAPVEFFDWPLSPGADASLAGARISISSFLRGRISQEPFRWVIGMGGAAIQCLVPETGLSDRDIHKSDFRGESFPLFSGARLLCVPGLSEMLTDPSCKALTWETLRFLNESPANI